MKFKITLFALICFGTFFGNATASLVISRNAELKSQVQTWTNRVCLWDVLADENIRAIVEMKCKSDGMECCPFELKPGQNVNLSKSDLDVLFSKNDWGGYNLELTGEKIIKAEQIGRRLSEDEIQNRLRNEIERILASESKDNQYVLQVSNFRINTDVYVRMDSSDSWNVEVLRPINSITNFKVNLLGQNTKFSTTGSIGVKLETEVYFSKNLIRGGEEIKPEDFELRKVNILDTALGSNRFYKKEEFPAGSRSKQSIMAGYPLSPGIIEKIPMIKFGDQVTLILRSDNLKISTKAISQGSAAVGDTISVQTQRFNKTFRGKLTQSKVVEVWL